MPRIVTLIAFLVLGTCSAAIAETFPWIEPTIEGIETRVNEAMSILLDRSVPEATVAEFKIEGSHGEPALKIARKQGLQSTTPKFRMEYQKAFDDGYEPEVLEFGLPQTARSLVYYRGNIYGWRYQAQKQNQFRLKGGISWDQIAAHQPWLEWQSDARKFILRVGEAAAGILKTYTPDEKITLYRGTVPNESWFLASLQKMIAANACDSDVLKSLSHRARTSSQVHQAAEKELQQPASSCSQIVEHLIAALASDLKRSESGHGAYFYTAERAYAAVFAKGSLVKVQFTRRDLEPLAAAKNLYFGTEDASEFAFIGVDGLKALLHAYVGSETPPLSSQDFYRPHFIWEDNERK